MITRKTYKNFSTNLFTDNQEILLFDVFHHIQAHLLYPLNCSCEHSCFCNEMRKNIILSLSMDLYNRVAKWKESSETLYATKLLLEIPEESFFKANYGNAYPLWLIEEKLDAQETKVYDSIRQFIWAFLRLARTYEVSSYNGPATSIKRVLEIIVGNTPLKAKGVKRRNGLDYRCGEKAYSKRLNQYKSVCHFIAAMERVHKVDSPLQIKEFLSLSEWIKEKLLSVRTPNVKDEHLFLREDFLCLPSWIEIDRLDLSMEPFWDKLEEIEAQGLIEFPKQLEAHMAKARAKEAKMEAKMAKKQRK